MTNQLRIGLIGTGRIGQVHARNIATSSDTALTWVCDPIIAGAESVSAQFGGKVSGEAHDVLDSGEVDAVVIASPTATHVDLIEAAIDRGIAVFCEKPIDLDMARVDSLRPKVLALKVPVALGFNRRFDPNFAETKRRTDAGQIGKLEQLTITSRDPEPAPKSYLAVSGGIFRDMTIHDFDMARFFLPNIVEVSAQGANSFSDDIRELADYDSVVVVMRGENEELITIINSRHAAYGYDQRIEAFGSQGMLQVANISPSVVTLQTKEFVESREPYEHFFLDRYSKAYAHELEEFAKLVRGETSLSPSYEDGRAALILADAADRSARSGGAAISVSLG